MKPADLIVLFKFSMMKFLPHRYDFTMFLLTIISCIRLCLASSLSFYKYPFLYLFYSFILVTLFPSFLTDLYI